MGPKKKEAKEVEDPGKEAREYVNPTPMGQLKSMDEPMQKGYCPHEVEAAWDDWWAEEGYYKGSSDPNDKRPKFSICLPPPNVTGSLHIGHALTVAVQDLLSRWHRMRGFNTLWIPGTDHAGIATQVVVEKKLAREQQLSRHDLGREAFVGKIWEYKAEFHARITKQLRRLGCSLDWSREVFTMDAPRAASVNAAFVRFYDEGLIYRDVRLTNWCCALRSGISDIEVDYIDIEKRTRIAVPGHPKDKTYVFGVIWSFAYKLDGSEDEEVVVATTRPETMLGDTAVAVHPDDPRYKHLHGRHFVHPFNGRKLPLILDSTLVDMNFGTGAVKITPAHDPNDFAAGRRHGLPEITVFTDDGKMAENAGPFAGMMRFDARVEVMVSLKKLGLYRGESDNKMRLGKCSRTADIIEPMLKPQWWVNCTHMAKRAADAVRHGELRITPSEHEKTWYRWLDNIRDWCVSRQLWWGHRIPAYYLKLRGEPAGEVVAATREEALAKAMAKHGCAEAELELTQDEDVLDTWFSSGLFPFSTLGWPDEQAADYAAWHPTTLLETGSDIIFFWVARMVMCSLALTDKLPFTEVYLHAMVRDKYGQKMSKSKGNIIDPLEVISGISLDDLLKRLEAGNLDPKELTKAIDMNKADYKQGIPECGSDALRFGLLSFCGQGRDVNLDINRVVGYKNFCNKLWNATRFAMLYFGADATGASAASSSFRPTPIPAALDLVGADGPSVALPMLADAWILSRLATTISELHEKLTAYDMAAASQIIYDFWYKELCDVYLEAIKPVMQLDATSVANSATRHTTQTVLYACLHNGLRLLHPFMPFVTEELFHRLAILVGQPRSTIMLAKYPEPGAVSAWLNPRAEAAMDLLQRVCGSIRSLRSKYLTGALEKHAPVVYVLSRRAAASATLHSQLETISALAKSSKAPPPAAVHLIPEGCSPPKGCATEVLDADLEVHVLLKGIVDFSKELTRMQKEVKVIGERLEKLKAKMAKPDYALRCPQATQDEEQAKAGAMEGELAAIAAAMAQFQDI